MLDCVCQSYPPNCPIVSGFDEYIRKYNYNSSLKSLRLDAVYDNIPRLLNLERLNIPFCASKAKEYDEFKKLTYLKFHAVEKNALNNLLHISNLKVLSIYGFRSITKELFIKNHEIHTRFTNLQKLIIEMNNSPHSREKVVSINFPNLTSLRLHMTKRWQEKLSVIVKCTKLIQLSMKNIATENLSDYLKNTSPLSKLYLENVWYKNEDFNLSIGCVKKSKC